MISNLHTKFLKDSVYAAQTVVSLLSMTALHGLNCKVDDPPELPSLLKTPSRRESRALLPCNLQDARASFAFI